MNKKGNKPETGPVADAAYERERAEHYEWVHRKARADDGEEKLYSVRLKIAAKTLLGKQYLGGQQLDPKTVRGLRKLGFKLNYLGHPYNEYDIYW